VPQTKPTPKPINRPNQTEQSRLIEASSSGMDSQLWPWVVGIAGGIIAAIVAIARVTDAAPKLWNTTKHLLNWFKPAKTEITLRDAKRQRHRMYPVPKDHPRWGQWEEIIEVIVSATERLEGCVVDLDTGYPGSYFQAFNNYGEVAKITLGPEERLLECWFYIPYENRAEKGELRLRCDKCISNWIAVKWGENK
jgi:hypothetical protein